MEICPIIKLKCLTKSKTLWLKLFSFEIILGDEIFNTIFIEANKTDNILHLVTSDFVTYQYGRLTPGKRS